MTGNINLVGSVTLSDAKEVFETASASLGPRIKRIPNGETGERRSWIFGWSVRFLLVPLCRNPGRSSACIDQAPAFERYTLKPGCRLSTLTPRYRQSLIGRKIRWWNSLLGWPTRF